MGRAERENEAKTLEAAKKELEKKIEGLSDLLFLEDTPQWKRSVDGYFASFLKKAFAEFRSEKQLGEGGKMIPVQPGEILIRQRVFNRSMEFMENFENIKDKLSEAQKALEKYIKSEEILNEDLSEVR